MPWSRMVAKPGSILNHPTNAEIYGREEPDPALIESIKANGVLIPGHCVMNDEGRLVALDGHRRKDAAAAAGLDEIEVNVWRGDMSHEDQVIWICEANRQRTKTAEQLYREGDALKRAYAEQARKRMEAGKADPVDTVSLGSEKGRARDKAAKDLGINARTLDRGINAVHAIDEAKAAGDTERAEKIRNELNTKGAAAAEKIARNGQSGSRPVQQMHKIDRFRQIKSHIDCLRQQILDLACDAGMKSGLHHKSVVSALEGLEDLVSDFRKEYRRVKVG